MVIFPLLTYATGGWMMGWASAPYDPRWALQFPRRSAIMALAGPAVNLSLVILAAFALRAGMEWHAWTEAFYTAPSHLVEATPGTLVAWLAKLLSMIFSLNLLLGIFNLLPLPSLDGSSLPLLFLPAATAQRYLTLLWSPGARFAGLFLAWQGFRYIFEPIQRLAVQALFIGAS